MSNIPTNRHYTRNHEWLRRLADGAVEVGITDHAQHALGDLVFVELPAVGRSVKAGEACAVVESVKAASDVYSPIAGTVTEINTALASRPELLNEDPYEAGWMMRMESGAAAADALLDAAAYAQLLADEAD